MKAKFIKGHVWRVTVEPSEVSSFIAMAPGTRKSVSRDDDGTRVYDLPATYICTHTLVHVFKCRFEKPGGLEMMARMHRAYTTDFPWKQFSKSARNEPLPPMEHQMRAINKFWPWRIGGIYHDKGTGKTFTYITLACAWWPEIEQILVVAPNSVVENWPIEIEKYAWCPYEIFKYEGPKSRSSIARALEQRPKGLRWLIMPYESLSAGNGPKFIGDYVTRARTAMVADESQFIKNWKSGRTKVCIEVGAKCERRHAMTGNPITQHFEELFATGLFLDWRVTGYKEFWPFRGRYCIMGGYKRKNIVGYDNEDELMANFGPYIHVVEKRQALPDLPPKIFEVMHYQLTEQQMRMIASIEGKRILNEKEIKNVLEAFLRMQQVCSGVLPEDFNEPITKNPKADLAEELVRQHFVTGQILVWCKWRAEIDMLVDRLAGHENIVELHGGIERKERQALLADFEKGKYRVAIATPSSLGIGVDKLKTAETTIFYSNTFSWDERSQAEDRTHRKGIKGKKRLYIDLIAKGSVDEYVRKCLSNRMDVADAIRRQLEIAGRVIL